MIGIQEVLSANIATVPHKLYLRLSLISEFIWFVCKVV